MKDKNIVEHITKMVGNARRTADICGYLTHEQLYSQGCLHEWMIVLRLAIKPTRFVHVTFAEPSQFIAINDGFCECPKCKQFTLSSGEDSCKCSSCENYSAIIGKTTLDAAKSTLRRRFKRETYRFRYTDSESPSKFEVGLAANALLNGRVDETIIMQVYSPEVVELIAMQVKDIEEYESIKKAKREG